MKREIKSWIRKAKMLESQTDTTILKAKNTMREVDGSLRDTAKFLAFIGRA